MSNVKLQYQNPQVLTALVYRLCLVRCSVYWGGCARDFFPTQGVDFIKFEIERMVKKKDFF